MTTPDTHIMVADDNRHTKKMQRHTLLLYLPTLIIIAILPWSSKAFAGAHPALPIPNARPDKRRFAPDRYDGTGTSSSSSRSSTATTSNAKGKSVAISGTPFRGISRRFSSSSSSDDELPPSQLESIVANAKSLSRGLGRKMDLTNPTLRTQYFRWPWSLRQCRFHVSV